MITRIQLFFCFAQLCSPVAGRTPVKYYQLTSRRQQRRPPGDAFPVTIVMAR